MLIATFTKRAQAPFRAWLPAAMAAPTPVSSLVHSSTLVTAGVYVILRLGPALERPTVFLIAGAVGALTIIMARLSAFLETDLKKIVALSTLRQLGVMVTAAGLNSFKIVFFHLVAHAFFKALLFIATGVAIYSLNDYQDLRRAGAMAGPLKTSKAIIVLAKVRLCGIPFFSGFYSKEIVLETLAAGTPRSLVTYLII